MIRFALYLAVPVLIWFVASELGLAAIDAVEKARGW